MPSARICHVATMVKSHVLEQVRMAKWMHEFVRMAVCSVDNPDMLVEAAWRRLNSEVDASWQ